MASCAFCGRENEAASRFCIDCGKPMNPSAARVGPAYRASESGEHAQPYSPPVATASPPLDTAFTPPTREAERMQPCPKCSRPIMPGLLFCGYCGTRATSSAEPSACTNCGASYAKGVDLFCARCGTRVGQRVSVTNAGAAAPPPTGGTQVLSASRREVGPRLALLDESGTVLSTYVLERGEAVVGRGDADIRFEDDHYMSPLHARLELKEAQLCLRDLGSRNGSWVFLEQPAKLTDGDVILIGSQVIRFRRLGYPGPHPPEADSTRRMGSAIPSVDIAILEQLRADGSVRDQFHLSPGRSIFIGRETGDWLFPYDATMSGRHANIRSEDSEFFVQDAGSRNGVAMAVRGERAVKPGTRILLGDQILRVESL